MRPLKRLLAGIALFTAAASTPGFAQEVEVDLELVLAVDVSRSMDPAEQRLQKQGYVDALQHPQVLEAIGAGFLGRIAVTYVEWAGPGFQIVVAPWTLVDGPETAAALAGEISARPISDTRAGGGRFAAVRGTSISGALNYTAALFDENGYRATRQVIDVSGDGPNNVGFPVLPARAAALGKGITINGLPIMLHTDPFGGFGIRELDLYYEDCVIGGPGAFLITVETTDRLAEAIRRKLVMEIAGAPARIIPAQMRETRPPFDCLIGEKLRRRWMDP